MNFTKMQGAANDFVLVETNGVQREWPEVAIAICNRHLGVGADSMLLLTPSDKADFGMRVFDTDGSEAETCGNGIRCLAKYVFNKGLISPDIDEISVETISGVLKVKLVKNGKELSSVWANMGKPEFRADRIPLDMSLAPGRVVDINNMLSCEVEVYGMTLELNIVSMGNSHAVHFSREPVSEFPMSRIGPKVENLPMFPKRINFEVARVLNGKELEARVWERGVGETLACGSGACAITVASKLLGFTENKVDIILPGGTLSAEWNGNKEVILGGPAETVFEGKWPD